MKLDFSQLSHVVSRFLHRFHITLFVVLVVGGLSVATLMLNKAITMQANDLPATPSQGFDESTMTKIQNLHTTTDQTNLDLPDTGRTNPFK